MESKYNFGKLTGLALWCLTESVTLKCNNDIWLKYGAISNGAKMSNNAEMLCCIHNICTFLFGLQFIRWVKIHPKTMFSKCHRAVLKLFVLELSKLLQLFFLLVHVQPNINNSHYQHLYRSQKLINIFVVFLGACRNSVFFFFKESW